MGEQPDFTEKWEGSDVTFLLKNEEEETAVFANRLILSMCSPVFAAMLQGSFKEGNEQEIALPGKYRDEMVILLQVTHPPTQPLTEENVIKVYHLLEEYQLKTHLKTANDVLKTGKPSLDKLLLADRFQIKEAKKVLISWAASPAVWQQLARQPASSTLSGETLVSIFTQIQKRQAQLQNDLLMVLKGRRLTDETSCSQCHGFLGDDPSCGVCAKSRLANMEQDLTDTMIKHGLMKKQTHFRSTEGVTQGRVQAMRNLISGLADSVDHMDT